MALRTKPSAVPLLIALITAALVFVLGYYGGRSACRRLRLRTIRPARLYAAGTADNTMMRIQTINQHPRITLVHNFLTIEECDALRALAEPRMARSTVVSDGHEVHQARTSSSASLEKSETDVVRAVEERAAALSGFPNDHLEPLQVVRYYSGQQYRPHYDFFVPDAPGSSKTIARNGQRTVTFFVYLNDLAEDDEGGSTAFPKLGIRVAPVRGTAVMFWNVAPDGSLDYRLEHAGEPPTKSVKYGLNIWVRQKPWS